MRGHWILCAVAVCVCMGLLVVIVGQRQHLVRLRELADRRERDLGLLTDRGASSEVFRDSVWKLEQTASKTATKQEFDVYVLTSAQEVQKKEEEACRAAKKTISDEAAAKELEHTALQAANQAETQAWEKEIASLQEQLKAHSKICAHVKNDPKARELCGITVNTTTARTTAKKEEKIDNSKNNNSTAH